MLFITWIVIDNSCVIYMCSHICQRFRDDYICLQFIVFIQFIVFTFCLMCLVTMEIGLYWLMDVYHLAKSYFYCYLMSLCSLTHPINLINLTLHSSSKGCLFLTWFFSSSKTALEFLFIIPSFIPLCPHWTFVNSTGMNSALPSSSLSPVYIREPHSLYVFQ